jgi:urocanate hydratase
MLHFDVNNGIARRAWARNKEALAAIHREQQRSSGLVVTMPGIADESVIDRLFD